MNDYKNIQNFIEPYFNEFGNSMYLGFSGGKDSMVLLDSILRVYPNIIIIHNPKDETHFETVKFIYDISKRYAIVHIPPFSMAKYVTNNNLKCQIDGTRISEHNRVEKSNDVVVNGKSISRTKMTKANKCGLFSITHIYPIMDWVDEDIYKYIKDYNVPVSNEYKISGEIK